MTKAIAVEKLTKRFGAFTAVDGIDFDVQQEEFFALVGPSGCGKTTTLRCVAGLETADAGRILISGKPVFASAEAIQVPTHLRSIGMVFQNYAVWPHMTVFENIVYPLRLRGASRPEQRKEVDRVLTMLGMEELVRRKPSQLSGGQQQRVALGRALVAQPDVLLLDEPLSNLDAKLRNQMRTELKRIQREVGIPILYVTHDQDEALSMSDRIAVMNAGRIHQLASPTDIYERPATKFVLDFIGSVTYIDVTLTERTGAHVVLTLPDGQSLSVPTPPRVPPGSRALLAVRPEDWSITTQGTEGSIRARVDLRSYRGSICEYRLQGDGYAFQVQTEKTHQIREGEMLNVQAEGCYLLDADASTQLEAPVS